MKIFHTIPRNKNLFKNPVVTIGNFDGVHTGHKKIFSRLLAVSEQQNGTPVVITFSSHPRRVLYPDLPLKVLTTTEEKVNAIFNIGITNIILLNFTKKMAGMSAVEFYNSILMEKLDAKHLVIGYDHAFGKNREGNFEFLKEHAALTDVEITQVDEEMLNDRPVSSTWLRDELNAGDIETANQLLGRNYSLTGRIVQGDGRGKGLGFPTANINVAGHDKLIPADGVYAVIIKFENDTVKQGMLNIGHNPTFNTSEKRIEVHIFNFDRTIYDSTITVEFHARIRDEVKFPSPENLIDQLFKDKDRVVRYFGDPGD